ncbi:MAG TPA: tetratricopeptide repeat protein, partial [Pirellulales bacterium]
VWKELKKRDDAGEYKRKKGDVRGGKLQRRIWWSKHWIPLTEGKDIYDPLVRASTMVDLAPGRDGDVGQILFWSPDSAYRDCLGPSWTTTLEQFLLDLEDGAIVWEKRGNVAALYSIEPPPSAEPARPGESEEDDEEGEDRPDFDDDDDVESGLTLEDEDELDELENADDAEDAEDDEDDADLAATAGKSGKNPAHGEAGHVHGPHCNHGREDRPYDTKLDPYFDRADALIKEEKWKEAIQEYTHILSEAPDDPDALSLRAYCRLQIGKLTEAAIDASRAIELDPRLIDALLTRAEIMEKTGSEGDALVDYERMLELDPYDVTALARSIETLATSRDPSLRNGDLAIELSEKLCVETNWKDPLGLLMLASSYAENDDYKNAVKWATKAVKFATPDVEADCRARLALFQAGKPFRREAVETD